MKKFAASMIATMIFATMSFAAPKGRTFDGEIMDSQCAKMGSHDMMIKKEAAKDAKECTQACVKMGGKYVLFNAANQAVYQLDDQTKPAQFAGEKVKVTGTLNKKTKTIHVTGVQSAS